jgi:hypothetical protein
MEDFKEVNPLEVMVSEILNKNLFKDDPKNMTKVIIKNLKVEITPAGRIVKFKSLPYINITWKAGSTKQNEVRELFNSDEDDYFIKLKLINMSFEDSYIRNLFSKRLPELILGMLNSGSKKEPTLGYKYPITTVLSKILQDNKEIISDDSDDKTLFNIIKEISNDIVDWMSLTLDPQSGVTACKITHPNGMYIYTFPKDALINFDISYTFKNNSDFTKVFDLLYIHDNSRLILELTKIIKFKVDITSDQVDDIDLNNYILSPDLISMFPRDYFCDGYATLKVHRGSPSNGFGNLLDVGSILIKVDNSFDNIIEIVIDQDMNVRTVVKFNQESSMRNGRFNPMTSRFKED